MIPSSEGSSYTTTSVSSLIGVGITSSYTCAPPPSNASKNVCFLNSPLHYSVVFGSIEGRLMQNKKTLEFWHDYHQRENDKEWILKPSDQLVELLIAHFPTVSQLQILEIGCGTSQLARVLYERLPADIQASILATDVSPVCIETNQGRDASQLSNQFRYEVMNVLEAADDSFHGKFNVVLDKGCLDTFLYRSSKSSQLLVVSKLLNNVWQWLTEHGKYIVLTPRPRIPILRDYSGFLSVTRASLHGSHVAMGDLDGATAKQIVYIHVCIKDPCKVSNNDDDHDDDNTDKEIPQHCVACGLTFQQFRSMESHAKVLRRWKGHQIHCSSSVPK